MNASPDIKLSTDQIRANKVNRDDFVKIKRNPIRLVLDSIQLSYNLGAIFRLADSMLVENIVICGVDFQVHKRKFIQAAQGASSWVPWTVETSSLNAVSQSKSDGYQVVVGEITSSSVVPEQFTPNFPVCLVLGNERKGVTQGIVDIADASIAIPMLGMCNSLNVSTAAAILLYNLTRHLKT